ncbi:MAG TPA: hypothetical protein VHE58_04545 [Burkholderiales bacterium]|nr:hypothetical protein [Burkholderiales bacterium]
MVEIIALVAAVTALCAVLLGPLVALWTTQRQSRIAVRATNRQAWINSLRDAFAEFISLASLLSLVPAGRELYEKVERLAFLEAKIKLLLNPKETDHQQLMSLVGDTRRAVAATIRTSREEKDHELLVEDVKALVPLVQAVLKREWERVKRVE